MYQNAAAEMLAAVLAEQPQLTFSDISVALPLIEEKKLKALAVTTPERWPAIANLPTMIEGQRARLRLDLLDRCVGADRDAH